MSTKAEAMHWIRGEWLAEGQCKESIDPATGQVIGYFHDATAATMQLAIDAAAEAFAAGHWRDDAYLRATALGHLADAFARRQQEVVDMLCAENGKLRAEATFEASLIPRALRFVAGLAMHNFGRVVESRPGQQSMSIREPVGVAGLIIPWNSPAYLCIRALAPALAAGCTAVVKMPHQAAQTAALLANIVASVPELPKGVVNIVTESGADGARLLVDSPQVPVVSFTGSTATGRAIARAAADRLKRVGLELGGKTPHLIFDDADLAAVLPVLEKSSTVFAGQFCMTGSRILVQRGIVDAVRAGLAQRLEAVRVGPAREATSQMGPLIDKAAVARVNGLVEAAIAAGARPIVRGGPALDPALAGGAFYRPTLLEIADQSLPIAREETFGPVQTLQVFDTEAEAIALANDSDYGLSACVWSRDVDRPIRVARRLQAGLVSINSWANLAVEMEEGGFKSSGLGRLGGLASVEDFLEYKQITQDFIPHHH
ncbi:aldehyde dehydrogenase family protein [Cupriavidus sp. SZY C1]|uniref:aldehyde dehydrogenase family protein n=1 Tax=Cupriavidus sp. SZY C1 TaxID=3055037 RepID=UPI0028B58FDB|nr:aldehyde dehydrogenase family protein [Cupriavidus sp. SZY C1]MDT6963173.1 aldehyde dehydrogenase family protein [Cupriavidus sp. SZY C1]